MYNRYVPQKDGTYSRKCIPDKTPPQPQKPTPAPEPSKPCPPAPAPRRMQAKQNEPSPGLLQRLIPGGLDTEDLLVILLLLLIAGDCKEDQSFALLTLGLYLFM